MKTNVSSLREMPPPGRWLPGLAGAWLRGPGGRRAWMTAPPLFGSTAALARKPHGQTFERLLQCPARAQGLAARADVKCVRPGPWGFREGSGS